MHYAVADRDKTIVVKLSAEKLRQVGDAFVMTDHRRTFGPAMCRNCRSSRISCDEASQTIETFNLATQLEFELLCAHQE